MTISILSNIASLQAQRNLNGSQMLLADNIGRLSSGQRINRAADDAAGLGISENLKAGIRGVAQATRNTNDGVSLTQVAEGALNEMQGMVIRMRELAVQAANGTLGATERGYVQTEFTALKGEIDRLSEVTEYNGQQLLNGDAAALTMQVGFRATASDTLTVAIASATSDDLGITAAVTLSTSAGASAALAVFDAAITSLSQRRAALGAVQNRMQVTVAALAVAYENLSSGNSRIRDVDVANETSSLTRNQILNQAGVAVLAQANQIPSAALSLLR